LGKNWILLIIPIYAKVSLNLDALIVHALNADIAKVTGKTIGTVSGLEYSYTHASKTLIISKTSGTFGSADMAKVINNKATIQNITQRSRY
jgi:hypothetical protein